VLELTDLSSKRDDSVEALSRGMKQRLCLAKTLVHDPAVLLLDEPASGLDPRARIELRELLKELRRMGKTILISSHILTELSDFCNKIAIIEKGQLLVSGEVDAILRRLQGNRRIEIRVSSDVSRALDVLRGVEHVRKITVDGQSLVAEIGPEMKDTSVLLDKLIGAGVKVSGVKEVEMDLEDAFMKITQGAVQ
jgi:ABC-2 type transport system ATP-binding protein